MWASRPTECVPMRDFANGDALLAPLVKGERANEVGEGIP